MAQRFTICSLFTVQFPWGWGLFYGIIELLVNNEITPRKHYVYMLSLPLCSHYRPCVATPLVDGIVVSRTKVGDFVRQTVLNICKRKRLDNERCVLPGINDINNCNANYLSQPANTTNIVPCPEMPWWERKISDDNNRFFWLQLPATPHEKKTKDTRNSIKIWT